MIFQLRTRIEKDSVKRYIITCLGQTEPFNVLSTIIDSPTFDSLFHLQFLLGHKKGLSSEQHGSILPQTSSTPHFKEQRSPSKKFHSEVKEQPLFTSIKNSRVHKVFRKLDYQRNAKHPLQLQKKKKYKDSHIFKLLLLPMAANNTHLNNNN